MSTSIITVENFDKLYPHALKGFGVKYDRFDMPVSYYSRAMNILGSQVTVWWHSIPEMVHVATVECSNQEVLEFVTDKIWEAKND